MSADLRDRIAQGLAREAKPAIRAFAEKLAAGHGAAAALFYGSNLRTGEFDGVLDYYLLLPGPPERGLWPLTSAVLTRSVWEISATGGAAAASVEEHVDGVSSRWSVTMPGA